MDQISDNRMINLNQTNEWLDFLNNHRYKIWVFGFILRLIASGTNLKAYDYINYRIPISHGIVNGSGLYSDLKYNQMPVYPYLSALMYFLFGDQNDILTAVILRFPITVADSIIPIVLYYLGIEFRTKKEGIIASTIYVFNPLSLIEISVATFHSIGTLFLLLSVYFLFQKQYFIAGICISLGFFTSEFPIIALGVTFVYLRHDLRSLIQSVLGFTITSTLILSIVLIPSDTSLSEMYNSLKVHPIYKGTIRGVISELFEFFHNNYNVSEKLYYDIWLIIFLILAFLPLIFYMRYSDKNLLLDVLIIQVSLLSLFFTANHTKHIFWLFPWLAIWVFVQGGNIRFSILFLTITYLLRRLTQDFFDDYVWISTVILGILGVWIISTAFKNLLFKAESSQFSTNKSDVNL